MKPPVVAIVTPPLCSQELPQLGPATLKGFAEQHGVGIEQIDLNVAFRQHLRDKIDLDVLDNPGDQQNPQAILDLLVFYFTDRFVAFLREADGYATPYLDPSGGRGSIEHYQAEAGAGLGLSGIVGAPPALLARFVRDRALNYYHRFLDETGHAETIAEQCAVVGFSLMGPTQVVPTLTLALRLKELRSDLVVVLGGPWVSLFAAELAAAAPLRPFFDVLVEGEGEAAWLAIARAGGAAPGASVPNAWVRTAKGLAPPRDRFVADLAEIGTPSFDGLDLDCYGAPRPVLLQSGRGCYWDRCAFCVHTGRGQAALGPRVRLRPLALVAADIAELVRKHAPRYLAFADLSVSPARMRQLCRIMEDGRIDLPWFAFVRLDPGFDRSLLERMRRAGCLKLNFGLESGSARILELLDKGHDLETARRIIDDAIDLGFRVTLHTMAGLPGESREDLDLTLALVDRYAPAVHESYTEIFRLEPGTRIHRSPHSFGIEPRPTDRGFDNCVPFENRGGLSQAEAMAIIEERLYAFYRDREELIYRSRSHFGMKHKHDFAAPSRFRARFRVELGGRVFAEGVTVETRGGGILRRVGGGEGQS